MVRKSIRGAAVVVIALTLSSCSSPCPEGQVYDLGQVMFVPIYDPALKISRLQPMYPFAGCKEARRG